MSLLTQNKDPKILQQEFNDAKSWIYQKIRDTKITGTLEDFERRFIKYDELTIGSALAELAFEGKLKLLDKKVRYREDGGAIILGIYGLLGNEQDVVLISPNHFSKSNRFEQISNFVKRIKFY